MKEKQRTPHYAVRLVVLILIAGFTFFGGLRLFIPEDRKGQIYTLMIFKYLRPAQDIHPAIMLAVINWRNYGEGIYRRSAL
jgi:hypothetical protein